MTLKPMPAEFKVVGRDPDPRGWEVLAADGTVVARVHQLIVDTVRLKVRYLDCELHEDGPGLEGRRRHVLIPVGYARLRPETRQVVVDTIDSTDVAALPTYDGGPLERRLEAAAHRPFTRGVGPYGAAGPRFAPERAGVRRPRRRDRRDRPEGPARA